MTTDFEFNCGKKPDMNRLSISLSTSDCEAYLKNKLKDIVEKKGGHLTDQEQVYSIPLGRDFIPLVVVLPTKYAKDYNRKQKQYFNPLFDTKDNDNSCTLHDEIYQMFAPYVYTKNDAESFKSTAVRNNMGASSKSYAFIKNMRVPRIRKANKNDYIMFVIDPIRLFYDMLTAKTLNPQLKGFNNFRVTVDNHKKKAQGVYSYNIIRTVNNGKNHKDDTIIEILNRKAQGTAR
jgi:hypothetical protein